MFDKNEELITVVDPEYLLESEQVQELNGLITTIVSAPYSKELESAFYIGSRDIDDNNIFWLYKVDKRTKETNNIILNGTYSLFDDLKAYDVIRDKRPSNASALVGINTVLEGSRWQVGNITSTHTGTANWYYVSRLEAFWEYLENWNVEFKPRMTFSKGKITGRYIDIVDKLSDDYGKWYEYGDKLLQVTAEQASDSLYTAFIGRGKGEESGNGYGRRIGFEKVVWTTASGKPVDKPLNQDYVEIPSATELYGYSDGKPRMTVVIFEDEEDSVKVLERTYDYALEECRPKLQLKANVLEDGVSELGETCTIIRDDRGIRYKTRVFKLTRNFLNKKQKTAEFGDEIVQSTAKRNSNTAKEIKKQEKQVINWLDDLQKELLDSYFNEDGYNYDLKADNEYNLPGGFYSFNAPIDKNPTKLIYMGAGSLAIANSKNPDGSWNFRTWGTGDGFTADLIRVGTLSGINISGVNFVGTNMTLQNRLTIATETGGIHGNFDFANDVDGTFNPRYFRGNYRLGTNHFNLQSDNYKIASGGTSGSHLGYSETYYGSDYLKMRLYNNNDDLAIKSRVDITSGFIQIADNFNDTAGVLLLPDGSVNASTADIRGLLKVGTDINIIGQGIIGGQLDVSGSSLLRSALDVQGNSIFRSTLDIAGSSLFRSTTDFQGSSIFRSSLDILGNLIAQGAYDNTYSSAPNMFISSNGYVGRATSATKYKLNISDIPDIKEYALKVLELNPKQWFDKHSVETYAKECDIQEKLTEDVLPITPFYGLIAEDLVEAGLDKYVQYGENGEVEGIMYDRLSTLLIPIAKQQKEEIKTLKEENELMKNELRMIKEHLGLA